MEPLRLMRTPDWRSIPDVAKFAAFWKSVSRNYAPAFVAQNRPLMPSWMVPEGEPPHDWLYPYPSITIWERKASAPQ
jgi:hypothetical protein